jgi:hypothetical protein
MHLFSPRIHLSMDLTIVPSTTDMQTAMIALLSNYLIEQLNVNRRTCHIAMKVVSAGSFCSMVWWGARAVCAEVSTGSVEASKARLGFKSHMAPSINGRVVVLLLLHNIITKNTCALKKRQALIH